MLRSVIFAGAMLAAGVVCAQDVAISGKDFLSGAADAKIAELARQAAASGKTLVISAPPYWQDKVAAKAHAGAANATLRMSDAFFENVMIRLEPTRSQARTAEAPRAQPRPEPRREVRRAARVERKPAPPPRRVVAERPPPPKPAPAVPQPPPKPAAPVVSSTPVAAAPAPQARETSAEPPPPPPPAPAAAPSKAPSAQVVAKAAPAPPPVPARPEPAAPDPAIALRKRMEQNLNDGAPAEGTIDVAQLQKNDWLFVDGPVRGVVRRFGPRTHLYWLTGQLNLERAELVPTGPGRYRVSERILNVANPTLRGSAGKALMFTANVPAPSSKARQEIESRYNDGRNIIATLQPGDLRQGDLVYTNQGSAVVIRRTSGGMVRYWLVGRMDLHQTGLQTQGNAIRVLTDTVK